MESPAAHAHARLMRSPMPMMDVLVINNLVFLKEEQSAWSEEGDWKDTFELD